MGQRNYPVSIHESSQKIKTQFINYIQRHPGLALTVIALVAYALSTVITFDWFVDHGLRAFFPAFIAVSNLIQLKVMMFLVSVLFVIFCILIPSVMIYYLAYPPKPYLQSKTFPKLIFLESCILAVVLISIVTATDWGKAYPILPGPMLRSFAFFAVMIGWLLYLTFMRKCSWSLTTKDVSWESFSYIAKIGWGALVVLLFVKFVSQHFDLTPYEQHSLTYSFTMYVVLPSVVYALGFSLLGHMLIWWQTFKVDDKGVAVCVGITVAVLALLFYTVFMKVNFFKFFGYSEYYLTFPAKTSVITAKQLEDGGFVLAGSKPSGKVATFSRVGNYWQINHAWVVFKNPSTSSGFFIFTASPKNLKAIVLESSMPRISFIKLKAT